MAKPNTHHRTNPRYPVTLSPATEAIVLREADASKLEPSDKRNVSAAIREIILEWEAKIGSKKKPKKSEESS
jgi:hypothetical protein